VTFPESTPMLDPKPDRWPAALAVLAVAFLCLAAPVASAQVDDVGLDEIARLFGAKGRVVDAVQRLGGKVVHNGEGLARDVVGVNLSGTKVADPDLVSLKDRLKDLPALASLDLSSTGITDAGLVHLRELTGLYKLNVAQTHVTDAGVAALLRELRTVQISRRPRTLKYFPNRLIDPGGDDFLADWYSEDLYAMKEPSLWALSREDRKAVAYRFLWLPSFRPPLAVRVVPSGDGAVLDAIRLDGPNGYRGAKPVSRRNVKLTRDQWAELRRRIDDARFWSLPSELWTYGIADGAGYVVEGIKAGRYHVVNANTNPNPDDRYRRYKALCEEMVRLSGLENMDVWRRY
jgi:hypothetical protein